MAVIQKIRNKYGKLAGGIIAVALLGFILMDAFSGKFGGFGHNTNIAKVNGEGIEQKEYSMREKEYETIYGVLSNGKTIDDNTRGQLNTQALQNMLFEKVAAKDCDKLGIETTDEEKKDIIYGNFADPLVRQFPIFADPETGQFDPRRVSGFEKQADQNDPQQKKALDAWYTLKDYVIRNNRYTKFASLFVNTMYTPKYLTERTARYQGEKASIRFIKIPLASVNDNEVKVTDDDLKAYMQKHKALFQVEEPFRNMEYVSFDVFPTRADTLKVLDPLTQLKGQFENTKENETFVNRNSEEPYRGVFVNKTSYKSRYADTILKQPVDGVFGPYFDNGAYKLTKVIEKQELPDTVKFRHILLVSKYQGKEIAPDSVVKARMDSIVTAIKTGSDFKALAAKYSNDSRSNNKGGEVTITISERGSFQKPVDSFVFEGKAGESKLVKIDTDAYTGYHYIEILEQKGIQPAVKLATISKPLYASDSTDQAIYAKASEFAGKNNTSETFENGIVKDGYNKRIAENIKAEDQDIKGLGPDREIVRWLYSSKPGSVSNVFRLENPARYVVAKVTGIQDKGQIEITPEIRPRLEAIVRNEKKADIIVNKYKGSASLDILAQSTKQQIQNADSFNLSAMYLPNLGFEPKVVGYSFYKGLNQNAVSPGIKGADGVFFISVTNRWTLPIGPGPLKIAEQQVMMQEAQQKNNLNETMRQMILKSANVKYYPDNI